MKMPQPMRPFKQVGAMISCQMTSAAILRQRPLPFQAQLCQACVEHVEAVYEFLPLCNPMIRSDALVSIDLMSGAARAAWRTRCCGTLSEQDRSKGEDLLKRLRVIEDQLGEFTP